MDFFDVLNHIAVPNSDNGEYFINDRRLERIDELLYHTRYRKVNPDGLFVLYAAKPLKEIEHPVVISTHVDCVQENMNCFVAHINQDMILGTFDNMITNAAVLTLMLNNELPDHVLIAFTGDEEDDSAGAAQLSRFLAKRRISAQAIVLDVTDMGWKEGAAFSVENNFWQDALGKTVISVAKRQPCAWTFVPESLGKIPPYVPMKHIIRMESEPDESWQYDECGVECFSFCLPVYGNMHSPEGVLARKQSCLLYTQALKNLAQAL